MGKKSVCPYDVKPHILGPTDKKTVNLSFSYVLTMTASALKPMLTYINQHVECNRPRMRWRLRIHLLLYSTGNPMLVAKRHIATVTWSCLFVTLLYRLHTFLLDDITHILVIFVISDWRNHI